ncbi:hypothetical protein MNBD_GAMMA04-848 [hydrothermal vent metagenome]|uniref:ABC transporter domain-containing protein n=1 Tax=hydrothermal vent metagenome TaxID=652676 RepID=A0A3B0WW97_9ZZZZ
MFSESESPTIQVQQLSVELGGACLLHQVSCQFHAGKIHTILGQNGAGKSTLLHCLSHEMQPSQGHIVWQGKPLKTLSYAELACQRAVLSQSNELAFSFSVEALVSLGEEVQQRTPSQSKQVIETVLAVCDMTNLKHRDYLTLSGGEKKRAQLARVLAQIWPVEWCEHAKEGGGGFFLGKWLLLDEWTAGLDIKHQQSLARYFKQWAAQGLGIIMVLHDISLAAQLADDCCLLKDGKVFAMGDVTAVLQASILQQALEMNVRVEMDKATQRPLIYPVLF